MVSPEELNPTYIVPSVFDPTVAPLVRAWDLRGAGRIASPDEINSDGTVAIFPTALLREDIGFVATESGPGYTWSENSRQNQLTAWSNDAVTDPVITSSVGRVAARRGTRVPWRREC